LADIYGGDILGIFSEGNLATLLEDSTAWVSEWGEFGN